MYKIIPSKPFNEQFRTLEFDSIRKLCKKFELLKENPFRHKSLKAQYTNV